MSNYIDVYWLDKKLLLVCPFFSNDREFSSPMIYAVSKNQFRKPATFRKRQTLLFDCQDSIYNNENNENKFKFQMH